MVNTHANRLMHACNYSHNPASITRASYLAAAQGTGTSSIRWRKTKRQSPWPTPVSRVALPRLYTAPNDKIQHTNLRQRIKERGTRIRGEIVGNPTPPWQQDRSCTPTDDEPRTVGLVRQVGGWTSVLLPGHNGIPRFGPCRRLLEHIHLVRGEVEFQEFSGSKKSNSCRPCEFHRHSLDAFPLLHNGHLEIVRPRHRCNLHCSDVRHLSLSQGQGAFTDTTHRGHGK